MTSRALKAPATKLNAFLAGNILNAPAARHNIICRYHVHEQGNICLFGDACHYLHLAHLDRPVFCQRTMQDRLSSDNTLTPTKLSQVQDEIKDLRAEITAMQQLLTTIVCPTDDSVNVGSSSAIKTKRAMETPTKKRTTHESASTASDPEESFDDDEDEEEPFEHASNQEILRRNAQLLRLSASETNTHKHSQATREATRGPLDVFEWHKARKAAGPYRPSINQLVHGGYGRLKVKERDRRRHQALGRGLDPLHELAEVGRDLRRAAAPDRRGRGSACRRT